MLILGIYRLERRRSFNGGGVRNNVNSLLLILLLSRSSRSSSGSSNLRVKQPHQIHLAICHVDLRGLARSDLNSGDAKVDVGLELRRLKLCDRS